jgi:diacylglycerol kinase family enzyme
VRVTLFHNPAAGDSATTAQELESILSDAGYQVRYQSTKKDWRSALDDLGDLVVVAGGDGTVAEVARALADTDVPLAVLPFGTANNIGKALGAFGDVHELVARWRDGPGTALDIGVVSGPFGEQRFVEAVGGGIFAELIRRGREEVTESTAIVGRETDRALQLLRVILGEVRPAHWEIELDGDDVSGSYVGVEAMNIGFAGPNIPLAGDADLGDGELDLVLLRDEDRGRVLDYVVGRLESASALMPSLDVRRGRHVHLVPPAGWPIRIDDELAELGPAGPKSGSPPARRTRRGGAGPDAGVSDSRAIEILIRPRAVRIAGGPRAGEG